MMRMKMRMRMMRMSNKPEGCVRTLMVVSFRSL